MVEGSSSGLPEKTGLFALNTTAIDPRPPASDSTAQGFRREGRRDEVGTGREDKGKQTCILVGHQERERIQLGFQFQYHYGHEKSCLPPVALRTPSVLHKASQTPSDLD